jgi:hypothetical protein
VRQKGRHCACVALADRHKEKEKKEKRKIIRKEGRSFSAPAVEE